MPEDAAPLAGVRVVDLTDGVGGPYCTKLLADAGADVVVVEPPGGAASRTRDPGQFAFLHTSKRSVGTGATESLVTTADIVVAGIDFDVAAARERSPGQVVVTVTPFGTTGPWKARPATEFTMQAACGSTGGRGLPDRSPLAAGGQLGEWITGVYAGVGALAAWIEACRSGIGTHVDVSMFDCMAIGSVTYPSVIAGFADACGRPVPFTSPRRIEVPSIEPTKDGWVTFTTNSAQQFHDFVALIGRPEFADDERFARFAHRFLNRDAFTTAVHAYTEGETSAAVMELASLMRIPVAPVLDPAHVASFEQFAERGVFIEHPGGGFRQPRVPYRIGERERARFRAVPTPPEHHETIAWTPRATRPGATDDAARLPLAGIRVVDFTAWWAGPCATQVLGCLGADVIKIESITRPDLMRYAGPQSPADPFWCEWGPLAHAANTNKRGVTIDLTRPEGRALVLRLLETADLAVENYTPRVMEQFDLGWDVLHALNPRLNLVRMPAFGLDGPWRDHPGFAQTMESLTGLAWVTGYEDGGPTLVGGAGDPIAGLHATYAAMIALIAREQTGEGAMIESTMVEAVLNAAAPLAINAQLTGAPGTRCGNRSQRPDVRQGVYPCRDEDTWIAIAVEGTDQVRALNGALPGAALSLTDHADAWDAAVATSTRQWTPEELAECLTADGVPAEVVIVPRFVSENPQLVHRELFETEDHPITGPHGLPGLPFRFSGVDAWLRRPSPMLGQHNDEVFAEIGLTDAERASLRELGIIGDRLLR
jgi:crotonobetainyl-CoA:carnitine CoA-transferase CaiB-like acyl-CoA transferase